MRSVADTLRDETRRRTASLPPEDRILLALELGDADVAALAEARQITVAAAKARFSRSRRVGRRPSRANDE